MDQINPHPMPSAMIKENLYIDIILCYAKKERISESYHVKIIHGYLIYIWVSCLLINLSFSNKCPLVDYLCGVSNSPVTLYVEIPLVFAG